MLRLGIKYVKDNLCAKRIDLGVFADNDSARYCYEAIGFVHICLVILQKNISKLK